MAEGHEKIPGSGDPGEEEQRKLCVCSPIQDQESNSLVIVETPTGVGNGSNIGIEDSLNDEGPVTLIAESTEEYSSPMEASTLNVLIEMEESTLEASDVPKETVEEMKTLDEKPEPKKGIEWSANSCYLDATLFSMLYITRIFDSRIMHLETSKTPNNDLAKKTASALKRIAHELRNTGFCASIETLKLRNVMSTINPKLTASMMDADDFLGCLLGRALNLKHFIKYSVESSNFVHQIILDPNEPVPSDVKGMLKQSMKYQNLKFAELPVPALILKMPISNGVKQFTKVLPNLSLNVGQHLVNEEHSIMHLFAVITLKDHHFTTFVRDWRDAMRTDLDTWYYFDSTTCTIIPQDGFSNYVIAGEIFLQSSPIENFVHAPAMLQKMMADCFICFYFSPTGAQADVPDQMYERKRNFASVEEATTPIKKVKQIKIL